MRLLVSFDSTTYVRPPIEFFTQLSRLHEFVSLLEGNGVKVSQIHIETFFFCYFYTQSLPGLFYSSLQEEILGSDNLADSKGLRTNIEASLYLRSVHGGANVFPVATILVCFPVRKSFYHLPRDLDTYYMRPRKQQHPNVVAHPRDTKRGLLAWQSGPSVSISLPRRDPEFGFSGSAGFWRDTFLSYYWNINDSGNNRLCVLACQCAPTV